MKRLFTIVFSFLLLCLAGCSAAAEIGYTQIDQDTAKEMMAADGTHIIVAVRTRDEYDSGHGKKYCCGERAEIVSSGDRTSGIQRKAACYDATGLSEA